MKLIIKRYLGDINKLSNPSLMRLLIRILNENNIHKVIQIPVVVRQSLERLFGANYPNRCYSISQLYSDLKKYSLIGNFNKAKWFLAANDYEFNQLFFSTDFNNINSIRGRYAHALKEMYELFNKGQMPKIDYSNKIDEILSELELAKS